ncbi:Interferon-inducible GTPase (IIGP) [Maublancomyces gigas]|uniref:Interferon-inducible GTPase (IIGP) n=1 Tax=Discina gigas TaxID=1032678 RepID=A0ABR3GTJ8_9PEZI
MQVAMAALEVLEAGMIEYRTENARQAEETRRVEDEDRRIKELRQVAEAKRAEDERLLAEAANEERRIETAKTLQATIEAEETTARITIEKEKLQQTCLETRRQYSQKVRLAMWPFLQEYETAGGGIQYDPSTFMFAVAGFTGTGKSSIINIFLNLPPNHKDGARTGIKETTRTITRYPDPGDKPPRTWTVWHDVPGAGTVNIPISRYFNNQCLFLMDVVLILVGDRVTEIDLEILSQCRSFDIPSMIIRSKSDAHIDNMAKSRAEETDVEIDDALRSACREEYIAETRENIATQLLENCLPPQYVYLVSCLPAKPFRNAYSSFAGGPTYEGFPTFIDEMKLIQDLMVAANRRRDRRTPGRRGNIRQGVAPGDVSAGGIALGTESYSTDKSQSVKEPARARIKDEAAGSTRWGKQYSWGHQQESTGSQSSPGKYIPPGRKPLSQSTKPTEIVPNNPRQNTTEIKPTLTPIQGAITTITLALARPSPVFLSAEILRVLTSMLMGRNLAIYINSTLQALAKPLNLRSVVCAGGGKVPKGYQHIVSGTPARVAHLIANGNLQMGKVRTLVLNMEQDIPQNLHQQIYDVYRHLPPDIMILRGIMEISSTGSK